MEAAWFSAAIWLGLALVAAVLSIRLRISVALMEILVGTLAQLIISVAFGADVLQANCDWVKFLAGAGAIVFGPSRAR